MRGEKPRRDRLRLPGAGSPPHARGKDFRRYLTGEHAGITPACAGKSGFQRAGRRYRGDHPRMRGEKQPAVNHQPHQQGSPPHARGKDVLVVVRHQPYGITPACAGKRSSRASTRCRSRDHPRMRGEKFSLFHLFAYQEGSPPHARGKADRADQGEHPRGITPACAGKR